MKSLLIALALTTTAFAGVSPVGKYANKHDIWAAFASASPESCFENGGRWEGSGDDAACLIEVEDTAEVTKKNGKLQLQVVTIGSNAHMCEFEGPATQKGNVITSKVKAEAYDHESDSLKPVTCIVTGTLNKAGTKLSIKNNGQCQEFCGANGWLEAELQKQK